MSVDYCHATVIYLKQDILFLVEVGVSIKGLQISQYCIKYHFVLCLQNEECYQHHL